MGFFTQALILIAVLAVMVMVLLGIRQLTSSEGFDDIEETKNLKKEIEGDGRILSDNNVFNTLIKDKEQKGMKRKEVYNGNSNDPLSPKE